MKLSSGQLEKLSELFLDIAKAMFLAALISPAITNEASIINSLKAAIAGFVFTYLSLKTFELKEVKK